MDENRLRTIVEEVVNKAVDLIRKQLEDPNIGLAAINKRLDDPEMGLERINEQLTANTGSLVTIESKLNAYGDMYKINDSNIRKMEKRLETIEKKEGLEVPLEFQLAEVTD